MSNPFYHLGIDKRMQCVYTNNIVFRYEKYDMERNYVIWLRFTKV